MRKKLVRKKAGEKIENFVKKKQKKFSLILDFVKMVEKKEMLNDITS